MEVPPIPTAVRQPIWRTPRFWVTVAVVGALVVGATYVGVLARQMVQNGRRSAALAERYRVWSRALRIYDVLQDPVKKHYVGQLTIYYDQLDRRYSLEQWQPWLEPGPDIVPPERPETLPGTIDPSTGIPPEVGEALANMALDAGKVDPVTSHLLQNR